MNKEFRTVGLITAGGDVRGLNAFLYAATCALEKRKINVVGIPHATGGLTNEQLDLIPLSSKILEPYKNESGTVLKSVTDGHIPTLKEGRIMSEKIKNHNLDGLIVIGGDGSAAYLANLMRLSGVTLPVVYATKTIDDDVPFVDSPLGFDSCARANAEIIIGMAEHSRSHERISVIEIMGRECGSLAAYSALFAGSKADAVFIPEVTGSAKALLHAMKLKLDAGQKHFVVVVSEGMRDENGRVLTKEDGTPIIEPGAAVNRVAKIIRGFPQDVLQGRKVQSDVLGHIQRCAAFSEFDRTLAEQLGQMAVEEMLQGGNVVLINNGYSHEGKAIIHPMAIEMFQAEVDARLAAKSEAEARGEQPESPLVLKLSGLQKELHVNGTILGNESQNQINGIFTKAVRNKRILPDLLSDQPKKHLQLVSAA